MSAERETRAWKIACVIATLVAAAYVLATMPYRFAGIFEDWVADPDQRQAVFHYWRYNISGAFPPGDFLTDYAFVMHAPPVWWLMMASLSLFIEPVSAAIALNVFAYIATCVAAWWAVRAFTNHIAALPAAMLVAHSASFHLVTAGGYARSFGPLLVLLFLGAFMRKKHGLTLAILLLQAGLYPSVVIPCGITYGAYCAIAGPMKDRIRRFIGVSLTGLVVISIGLYQDFISPDWWGSVVWLKEALEMPSWKPGGRIAEAPLRDPVHMILANFDRPFLRVGHQLSKTLSTFAATTRQSPHLILLGLSLVVVLIRVIRRKQADLFPPGRAFPWHPFALMLGAIAAYFLARALAFKLYLPYRSLTHTFPYILYVLIPLLAYGAAKSLFSRSARGSRFPRRRALYTAIACALAIGPTAIFAGDGFGRLSRSTYSSGYKRQADLFKAVRKLPLDANIAGTFGATDQIPLFAYHAVYINRVLAHPFRIGFYDEAERRIRENYLAIWADNPCTIVDFIEREKIDYIAYSTGSMKVMDKGIFQPIRRELSPYFKKNLAAGFYLSSPANGTLLFNQRGWRLLDAAKLVELEGPKCKAPPVPVDEAKETGDSEADASATDDSR